MVCPIQVASRQPLGVRRIAADVMTVLPLPSMRHRHVRHSSPDPIVICVTRTIPMSVMSKSSQAEIRQRHGPLLTIGNRSSVRPVVPERLPTSVTCSTYSITILIALPEAAVGATVPAIPMGTALIEQRAHVAVSVTAAVVPSHRNSLTAIPLGMTRLLVVHRPFPQRYRRMGRRELRWEHPSRRQPSELHSVSRCCAAQ